MSSGGCEVEETPSASVFDATPVQVSLVSACEPVVPVTASIEHTAIIEDTVEVVGAVQAEQGVLDSGRKSKARRFTASFMSMESLGKIKEDIAADEAKAKAAIEQEGKDNVPALPAAAKPTSNGAPVATKKKTKKRRGSALEESASTRMARIRALKQKKKTASFREVAVESPAIASTTTEASAPPAAGAKGAPPPPSAPKGPPPPTAVKAVPASADGAPPPPRAPKAVPPPRRASALGDDLRFFAGGGRKRGVSAAAATGRAARAANRTSVLIRNKSLPKSPPPARTASGPDLEEKLDEVDEDEEDDDQNMESVVTPGAPVSSPAIPPAPVIDLAGLTEAEQVEVLKGAVEERDAEIAALQQRCVEYETRHRELQQSMDSRLKMLRASKMQMQQQNIELQADVKSLRDELASLRATGGAQSRGSVTDQLAASPLGGGGRKRGGSKPNTKRASSRKSFLSRSLSMRTSGSKDQDDFEPTEDALDEGDEGEDETEGRIVIRGSTLGSGMSVSAFLKSVPLFHTLKPAQVEELANECRVVTFSPGDFILTQGDETNRTFYIIRSGVVQVYKKEANDMQPGHGPKVATLTEGHYFGERSLMSNKACAASCVADSEVTCLTVDKPMFHSVLSGIHQLLGDYQRLDSANEEVISLTQHMHKFMMLSTPMAEEAETLSEIEMARRQLLLELLTAFSPELSLEDVIERMVAVTYEAFQAERVSLWIKDNSRACLYLKVSKDGRGRRLPFVGLEGHVATTGATLNIPDVYQDERFDRSSDRRDNYRTHSMLLVPICIAPNSAPGSSSADDGGGGSTGIGDDNVLGVMQLVNRRMPVDHPIAVAAAAEGLTGSRRDGNPEFFDGKPTVVVPFEDEQADLLQTLSSQVAMVIKQHRDELVDGSAQYMPSHTLRLPFQLCVSRIITNESNRHLKVTVGLYHGGQQLCPMMETPLASTSQINTEHGEQYQAIWDDTEWLSSSIRCCNVPRATRVIFNVYSTNNHPKGWTGCHLVSFDHHMRSGQLRLRLWGGECPTPNATCLERPAAQREGDDAPPCYLDIEFTTYDKPVLFTNQQGESDGSADGAGGMEDPYGRPRAGTRVSTAHSHGGKRDLDVHKSLDYFISLLPQDKARRVKVILRSTIIDLSDEDKQLVWELRNSLKVKPEALPQFLRSVDWTNPAAVQEAYDLLYSWEPPTPIQALQLLDHKYPDPKVRAYAVQCLSRLSDDKLSIYLLQLTQVLKFEPFHDSALARFLLRRALANPPLIGHVFFWYLKAEMHDPDVQERYGLLLEQYLRNCGHHRGLLGEQQFVMQKLEEVARVVISHETKEERKAALHRELRSAVLPDSFQLPLSPHIKAKGIIVEKCRVMESKKKPLWLVFINADENGPNITVMFKAGDDLRQDQLTLQVLRIMNTLWQEEGLDLCMSPYGCVSTGDELGMLEVVLNAETLASIVAHGRDGERNRNPDSRPRSGSVASKKLRAAMDALNNHEVLRDFLLLNNVHQTTETARTGRVVDPSERGRRRGISQAAMMQPGATAADEALRRFAHSCAGYCVATYVLGIGDRHNDNIMLKRTGELFHIDFGHFLGNFKSKFGVKRERAPFVFTAAMCAVLGGEQGELYADFVDECGRAFNILRKHAPLLVTLFSLMLSCGIPELQTEEDIRWISQSLALDLTNEEAAERFSALIRESLNTKTTRWNDAAHLARHVT